MHALVDDEDFERLNQWKWTFEGRYASRQIYIKGSGRQNQKSKKVYLHTFIMNTPIDKNIDHIDHNKLN